MWFELCFVPLIPMKSKRIWMCSICQWNVPVQQGWEPATPGYAFHPGGRGGAQQGAPSGFVSPPSAFQPGYQPGYMDQSDRAPPGQKQ